MDEPKEWTYKLNYEYTANELFGEDELWSRMINGKPFGEDEHCSK